MQEDKIEKLINFKKKINDLGDVKIFNLHSHPTLFPQAIDHFEKNGIVWFIDVITHQDWNKFIKKTNKTGIVIIETLLPTWHLPSRLSVVRYNNDLMKVSMIAKKYEDKNIELKRKVVDFERKGLCMVGSSEYDRCSFIQTLYSFGIDEHLELYHPEFPNTFLNEDFLSTNDFLRPCEEKKLEPYHRFDYEKNLDVVKNRITKNDLDISLPNKFMQEPNTVSEKNFYGAIFGVPSFQVMDKDLQDLMKGYGFKFIYPEGKNLIKSSIEWISLFCRLSNDQRQRFQDNQGENAIQNHKTVCNLENILTELLEDDLRKL